MGIFLTELFGLFVDLEQSNAIHRRPTADPGHSHLYKAREIAKTGCTELVGYTLTRVNRGSLPLLTLP